MSDTNGTLPQSVISSVGSSSVDVCYVLASRLASIWTQERLLAKNTLTLKSTRNSSKSQIPWLRA